MYVADVECGLSFAVMPPFFIIYQFVTRSRDVTGTCIMLSSLGEPASCGSIVKSVFKRYLFRYRTAQICPRGKHSVLVGSVFESAVVPCSREATRFPHMCGEHRACDGIRSRAHLVRAGYRFNIRQAGRLPDLGVLGWSWRFQCRCFRTCRSRRRSLGT